MSAAFSLREAQLRDADRIAFLHGDNWRSLWRERLSSPPSNQFVMLAEHDDELAGFVCVLGNEDVLWGSLIEHLHVAHGYARMGLDTLLMAHAADWLRTHYPHSRVYLWAMEANASECEFYEQLGGCNVGTRHRLVVEGGSVLNRRYVWQLPQALQSPGVPPLSRSQPCLRTTIEPRLRTTSQPRLDPHDVS